MAAAAILNLRKTGIWGNHRPSLCIAIVYLYTKLDASIFIGE